MAVGYRSIFSLRRGQDAVQLAAEHLRSWLALKGYDFASIAPGVHEVAEHAQLVVTELYPHAGSRSLRYRLTEPSAMGGWMTTVTVHGDRADVVGGRRMRRSDDSGHPAGSRHRG